MLLLKDLWLRGAGEKVTGRDGMILKKLEGLSGGQAWVAGILLSDRVGNCERQDWGGQAESGTNYIYSYNT